MKIIGKSRGLGKTKLLIGRAKETGYAIIVANSVKKRRIVETTPEVSVYTIKEFVDYPCIRTYHKGWLIDDMDLVLQTLLDTNIDTATITIEEN